MSNLIRWLCEPVTFTMPRWQQHVVGGTLLAVNCWFLVAAASLLVRVLS